MNFTESNPGPHDRTLGQFSHRSDKIWSRSRVRIPSKSKNKAVRERSKAEQKIVWKVKLSHFSSSQAKPITFIISVHLCWPRSGIFCKMRGTRLRVISFRAAAAAIHHSFYSELRNEKPISFILDLSDVKWFYFDWFRIWHLGVNQLFWKVFLVFALESFKHSFDASAKYTTQLFGSECFSAQRCNKIKRSWVRSQLQCYLSHFIFTESSLKKKVYRYSSNNKLVLDVSEP